MTTTTPISAPFPEGGQPLLHLKLGACKLVLRPGGEHPWVEGTYTDPSDDDPLRLHVQGSTLTLTQGRSVAGTVRMVRGAPTCELALGTSTPFRLQLDTGASDVSLDLSGVPLQGIELRAGAGRLGLRVDTPNPVESDEASIRLGAGSLETHGLGNLAATRLRVDGGAASMNLDLTGELRRPMDARVSAGMSGVMVTVPGDRAVRITTDSTLGGVDVGDGFLTKDGGVRTLADGDPSLTLHASVALGQLRLRAATAT